MAPPSKCNINALIPTKNEITFTNQYEDLITKVQHANFSGKKVGGSVANIGVLNTLKGQTATMIANAMEKIGIPSAAKMATLFLPSKIQEKLIQAGQHEQKLLKQSGGGSRRKRKTQKRFGGTGSSASAEKPVSAEKLASEKSASAEKPASAEKSASLDKSASAKKLASATPSLEEEYEGERNEKNEKHGKGKLTYVNGDVYEGNWKNNKRNGEGTIVFQNKTTYTGRWSNDRIHGHGTFKYFNGDVYEGVFDNGKKSGDGTMTYENGTMYKGKWKNDMRHGEGKQTFPNGDIFKGEWRKDKRNGPGKLTKKSGEVTEDTWEDDETLMGFIENKATAAGSVVTLTMDSVITNQTKIGQVTFGCAAITSLLGALKAIKDSFLSLVTSAPTQGLQTLVNQTLSENSALGVDGMKQSLFNKINNSNFKNNFGNEADVTKFIEAQVENYNKGFFGGYGVYIAGIGMVTLGYFIYLRMFGDEEENNILDEEIQRKKSSSRSSRKKKRR